MSAPIKPDAGVSHDVLSADLRREADQRYSNRSSMRPKSRRRQRSRRLSVNPSWSSVPDRSRPGSGSGFGHGALPRNAPVRFLIHRGAAMCPALPCALHAPGDCRMYGGGVQICPGQSTLALRPYFLCRLCGLQPQHPARQREIGLGRSRRATCRRPIQGPSPLPAPCGRSCQATGAGIPVVHQCRLRLLQSRAKETGPFPGQCSGSQKTKYFGGGRKG